MYLNILEVKRLRVNVPMSRLGRRLLDFGRGRTTEIANGAPL